MPNQIENNYSEYFYDKGKTYKKICNFKRHHFQTHILSNFQKNSQKPKNAKIHFKSVRIDQFWYQTQKGKWSLTTPGTLVKPDWRSENHISHENVTLHMYTTVFQYSRCSGYRRSSYSRKLKENNVEMRFWTQFDRLMVSRHHIYWKNTWCEK